MRPPLWLCTLAFAVSAARPGSAAGFEALDARLTDAVLPRIERSVAASVDAQIAAALERAARDPGTLPARLAPASSTARAPRAAGVTRPSRSDRSARP